MKKGFLNEKLLKKMVEKELVSEHMAQTILVKLEAKTNGSLYSELMGNNLLTGEEILNFLKQEYGYPTVDPTHFTIAPEILGLVPQEIAAEHKVLPLFRIDNVLTLAVADPMTIVALDDLRSRLNLKFDVMLALPEKLAEAIEKNYSADIVPEVPEGQIEQLIEIVQKKAGEIEKEDVRTLKQLASETPVIKVTNLLIAEAIRRNASDLFIEPWEKTMRVRVRVDGLLEELKSPPKSIARAIVSRIKVMSQLDIAETRIPQDGRIKVRIQDREIDLRVSVIPSSFGEKVCLRILDKKATVLRLDKLGFLEDDLKKVSECAQKPHGMILVTGPTGSGKSTTLYAVLNMLHSPETNITAVEDPVEYQISGINQVNVKESVGLTFSASLRSILRQDPDIIMIGEIRDFETLDIAIKAALTGHLVLSTLHTNDAVSSLVRMRNMGVEPFLITSSVLMISAQRLARKLCTECREAYSPDRETIRRFQLDEIRKGAAITLYRPTGCPHCGMKGYRGRALLTEIFVLSPDIRSAVLTGASQDELKRLVRKEGMRTLRETGILKALEGETSLEEVIRMTVGEQEIEEKAA